MNDEKGLGESGGPGARLVPIPPRALVSVRTGERIPWGNVLGALAAILDKSTRERWGDVYKGGGVFPPEMLGCDVSG